MYRSDHKVFTPLCLPDVRIQLGALKWITLWINTERQAGFALFCEHEVYKETEKSCPGYTSVRINWKYTSTRVKKKKQRWTQTQPCNHENQWTVQLLHYNVHVTPTVFHTNVSNTPPLKYRSLHAYGSSVFLLPVVIRIRVVSETIFPITGTVRGGMGRCTTVRQSVRVTVVVIIRIWFLLLGKNCHSPALFPSNCSSNSNAVWVPVQMTKEQYWESVPKMTFQTTQTPRTTKIRFVTRAWRLRGGVYPFVNVGAWHPN